MPSSAALCGDALGIQEVCDLLWGFSGSAMSVDECDRFLLHFVQYQLADLGSLFYWAMATLEW